MKYAPVPVEEFPKEISLTPTEDLIEVYKTCLHLERLCEHLKIGGISAFQVGIPWALSVFSHNGRWRRFLNYSYVPAAPEKQPSIVRFVNVERGNCRYFLVWRHKNIEYRLQELIVESQPELVERVGTDSELGVFVQNECELLAGRYPHLDGEEFWMRK